MHRISALGNCFGCLVNGAVDPLLCLIRSARQNIRDRLESEQQAIETLQQGVVQFARNPRPFVYTSIESRVKLVFQPFQPHLVEHPHREKNGKRAAGPKPTREPPRRQYLDRDFSPWLSPCAAAFRALNAKLIKSMLKGRISG